MTHRLLCCIGSLDGGGSERQLLQFASRVDTAEFDPSIYLLYRRGPLLAEVPARIPVHAFSDAKYVLPKLLPGQTHQRQVANLKAVIERERIDLVYDRTFHMTLVTAAACHASDTPRVSVIVSPPSQDFQSSRERFRSIKRRRLALAYKTGTTIAVSQAVAADAAEFYGIERERILVFPNPVDVDLVQRASEQNVVPDNSPAADLRVVVVGRMSSEKGHALAIQALAAARQIKPSAVIHLDFLGDGPLRDELAELAKTLQVDRHVHFQGFVSNPYPWIARADLVCIPSQYEGLPNVALETLALGVPLVATNCSDALLALVGNEDERGVVVPVGDQRALAFQFIDRIEHPQAWLSRAASGSQWVCHNHSLSHWLQAMQSCLTDAVAPRSRAARRDGDHD